MSMAAIQRRDLDRLAAGKRQMLLSVRDLRCSSPTKSMKMGFPFSLALMHAYMVCLCLHASVPSSCTHECTYAEWGNIQYTTIHTCTRHLYIYILTCWLGCFLLHSPTLTEGIAEKFLQTREGSTTCRACPQARATQSLPNSGRLG